jgi:hypothetical protein
MTEQNNESELDKVTNDTTNNNSGQEPQSVNFKEENDDDTVYVALPIQSLDDAVKRLHDEANFAAKNFGAKSVSFAKNLNEVVQKLQETLKSHTTLIDLHKTEVHNTTTKLGILTLLPEKLEDRIEKLAPRLAIEVEQIHSKRLEEIINIIEKLQTHLDERTLANQQLIENTTLKCIEQIRESGVQLTALCSQNEAVLKTAEKFKQLIENTTYNDSVAETVEKFNQLKRDMQAFDKKRKVSYFVGLTISFVLMALVACAGTYFTLKYYPTHVDFTKPTEVTVSNSNVSFWGTKHLDIQGRKK